MKRSPNKAILVLLSALAVTSLSAQSSIVLNGGFERGTEGWTLGNLGMWVNFPNPAEGSIYAELRTFTYQDLPTVVGQTYHLRFAMAGNANWPGPISMQISWAENVVAATSWNPAGHNIYNLGWIYSDFDLVATAPTPRLGFVNLGEINQSAMIDAVSVVPVPEPSYLALLGVAAVAATCGRVFGRQEPKV